MTRIFPLTLIIYNYFLGTLAPKKSTVGLLPLHPIYDPKSMPLSFNAMEYWNGKLTQIRDQGWCGASWAITTADIASDKYGLLIVFVIYYTYTYLLNNYLYNNKYFLNKPKDSM